MLKIKHVPEQLFDVTAFPIMFVLMYTYLFGGALAGSPTEYLQFLLPGILVMIGRDDHDVHRASRSTPTSRRASSTASGRCRSGGRRRMVGYLLGDALRYTIASVVMLDGRRGPRLPPRRRRRSGVVAGDRPAARLLVRLLVDLDDVRAAAAHARSR